MDIRDERERFVRGKARDSVEMASLGDVASEWEAAAQAHAARRRPGAADRASLRDERKAHKRKVKAEQRERRDGAVTATLPAGLASAQGRAAPGSSHKPRRPSAREHRAAAKPDAWEATIERLQAEFGEDLCGLSGLVLAGPMH